jgi:hypothetical protein
MISTSGIPRKSGAALCRPGSACVLWFAADLPVLQPIEFPNATVRIDDDEQ